MPGHANHVSALRVLPPPHAPRGLSTRPPQQQSAARPGGRLLTGQLKVTRQPGPRPRPRRSPSRRRAAAAAAAAGAGERRAGPAGARRSCPSAPGTGVHGTWRGHGDGVEEGACAGTGDRAATQQARISMEGAELAAGRTNKQPKWGTGPKPIGKQRKGQRRGGAGSSARFSRRS